MSYGQRLVSFLRHLSIKRGALTFLLVSAALPAQVYLTWFA
jgi:hypothetical protein